MEEFLYSLLRGSIIMALILTVATMVGLLSVFLST